MWLCSENSSEPTYSLNEKWVESLNYKCLKSNNFSMCHNQCKYILNIMLLTKKIEYNKISPGRYTQNLYKENFSEFY
jgi:hypothetical protein